MIVDKLDPTKSNIDIRGWDSPHKLAKARG